jgi:MerR family transcriptional regulator, redox-sensitive transcriptional activator SoxR
MPDAPEQLTIGQIAFEAGVRTSAIRYYESIGLLPEPERLSGQRRYSSEVLGRLSFIAVGRSAGLSLSEIGALLEESESEEASQRLQELARSKLPDVEALISRGEKMKAWLEAASDCRCPSLEICALFGDRARAALDGDAEDADPERAGAGVTG